MSIQPDLPTKAVPNQRCRRCGSLVEDKIVKCQSCGGTDFGALEPSVSRRINVLQGVWVRPERKNGKSVAKPGAKAAPLPTLQMPSLEKLQQSSIGSQIKDNLNTATKSLPPWTRNRIMLPALVGLAVLVLGIVAANVIGGRGPASTAAPPAPTMNLIATTIPATTTALPSATPPPTLTPMQTPVPTSVPYVLTARMTWKQIAEKVSSADRKVTEAEIIQINPWHKNKTRLNKGETVLLPPGVAAP